MESCNNGNLDWLNRDSRIGIEQNLAIRFLKYCPSIEKATAWDGIASYFIYEWAERNKNFDEWSLKKNNVTREPEGLVTYSRTETGLFFDKKEIHIYEPFNDFHLYTHYNLVTKKIHESIL